MSNPFRARHKNDPTQAAPEASGSLGHTTPPLFVNTRVPTSQKHVNFASPPAVGSISPASYPSSPESTRQAGFSNVHGDSDGLALGNNPFQENTLNDEDDMAIAQALQNARMNSEAATAGKQATTARQANVRDTLSRFSSAGRKDAQPVKKEEENKKPSMDVNAFTRLLMTGQGGADAQVRAPSTFDSIARPTEATPRSSSEHERASISKEAKIPPPPPRPRSLRAESSTDTRTESERVKENFAAQMQRFDDFGKIDEPDSPEQVEAVPAKPSSTSKRPPPPPIARRKSQKSAPASTSTYARPDLARSGSSRYSINSESGEPPSPSPDLPTSKTALPPPPPPPSRRPNSQYGRRQSMELPATHEEDEDDTSTERPPAASKRISQSSLPPPPVPPPRKGRGASGRSSMDSQHRPSMSALGLNSGSARSSSEYGRPGSESRNASGTTEKAHNILADLEALQREVDAARASAGK
ncbi:uncharacterized protein AB675_10188 [Cyphellophora attinorum]|uniref:Uncharacterized protein n=1 Tax=Cyphellophora attinorum TaxID=1664694 RepID=A0A0N1NX46_9EURO|nr:uncharacterized protein AB675_10188 [Phialophora attinorum]KPI34794.1 hypothetical protein AB675_10188 [Phialophora attinorum]